MSETASSTVEVPASPADVNTLLMGKFAEALTGYMNGMQSSQRDFERDWSHHTDEMNDAIGRATKNIGRKQQPLSKELQEIVGALQSMPPLVPVVRSLIDRYMADVAAAYAAVNEKYAANPNEVPTDQPG